MKWVQLKRLSSSILLLCLFVFASKNLDLPSYQIFRGDFTLYNEKRTDLHQKIYQSFLKKSQKSPTLLVLLSEKNLTPQELKHFLSLNKKKPNDFVMLDFQSVKQYLPEAPKTQDRLLQQEVLDLQTNIFRRAILKNNSILLQTTKYNIDEVLNLIYRYEIGEKKYESEIFFIPQYLMQIRSDSETTSLIDLEALRENIIATIYQHKDHIPTPISTAFIEKHFTNIQKDSVVSEIKLPFKGLKSTYIKSFVETPKILSANSKLFTSEIKKLKQLIYSAPKNHLQAEIANTPPNVRSEYWRITTSSKFGLNLRKDITNNFSIISESPSYISRKISDSVKSNSRQIATSKSSISIKDFTKYVHNKKLITFQSTKRIPEQYIAKFVSNLAPEKVAIITDERNLQTAQTVCNYARAKKIFCLFVGTSKVPKLKATTYLQIAEHQSGLNFSINQLLRPYHVLFINTEGTQKEQSNALSSSPNHHFYQVYTDFKVKQNRNLHIVHVKNLEAVLWRHPEIRAKNEKLQFSVLRNLVKNLKAYGQRVSNINLLKRISADNKIVVMASSPNEVILNQKRFLEYIKHIVSSSGSNTTYILNASEQGTGAAHQYIKSIATNLGLKNIQTIGILYPGSEMEKIPTQDFLVISNMTPTKTNTYLAKIASERYLSKYYFWGLDLQSTRLYSALKKMSTDVIWVKDDFLDFYSTTTGARVPNSNKLNTTLSSNILIRGQPPSLNHNLQSLTLSTKLIADAVQKIYMENSKFNYPDPSIFHRSKQYTILQNLLSDNNQRVIESNLANKKQQKRIPNSTFNFDPKIKLDKKTFVSKIVNKDESTYMTQDSFSKMLVQLKKNSPSLFSQKPNTRFYLSESPIKRSKDMFYNFPQRRERRNISSTENKNDFDSLLQQLEGDQCQ